MNKRIADSTPSHRDQWLALLDNQGVGRPTALHAIEVPGGLVQLTIGEPPGRISLPGAPGSVLMFNLSPVQALRQTREGRSFLSHMLHGDMTLMPYGIPSQWSWNSTCDRLDVILSPDVLADGNKLAAVDRFLFRDREMEVICHRLYQAVSLGGIPDRLHVESLVAQLAVLIGRRHSTASAVLRIPPSRGLTRNQARRVLDYIEFQLSSELTLGELARTVGLSLHHFARMFKRTVGMAPHQYVLARRLERAKGMLRTTGASLVEISLATGFASQSHFTSTFRRLVGPTPTEFQACGRKQPPLTTEPGN